MARRTCRERFATCLVLLGFCLAGGALGAVYPPCREKYSNSPEPWRNCSVLIGGLAISGPDAFYAQWTGAFQDYLTELYNDTYGLEFETIALDFNENFDYVGNDRLDFIYSNPAAYVCMMVEFGMITISSMINLRKGFALEKFAGVIFSRADSNFSTIESLNKARIGAVSISGLGAMQLQQAELLSMGFNVMTDPEALIFAYNQGKIVADVKSGYVDVGFVRTDLIDRQVAAGAANWSDFQVINKYTDTEFPFARSTDFTPEWPIGAMQFVPFEIMELVGVALMKLEAGSDDPFLSAPAVAGKIDTWVTPMNYYELLSMLERISYYSADQKKCLRSSDVYSAIICPEGYVKKAEADSFCDECKTFEDPTVSDYTCVCKPCAKLKDPALVLSAETLFTSWLGGIDTEALEEMTQLETRCNRMGRCASVASGQRMVWKLLDQIGAESRLAINAPLLRSVDIKVRFDAEWQAMSSTNVTLNDGTKSQLYSFESEAGDVGNAIVQIRINGEQAEMSPVVVEHFAPPQRLIVCEPGQEALTDGTCSDCPPGSYGTFEGVGMNQKPVCWPCQPGEYQTLSGQASCLRCLPGSVSADMGATNCTLCDEGFSTIGMDGTSECLPCQPGEAALTKGSARCKLCSRGSYTSNESSVMCQPCGNGKTTADVGAVEKQACGCPTGSYLLSSDVCKVCPEEISCEGFDNLPEVRPGYYMKPGAPLDVEELEIYLCASEEHCPGGAPGTCAERRDANKIACGACNSDSFEFGKMCMECGEEDAMGSLAVGGLSLVGIGVITAFTWFLSNNPAKKNTRRLTLTATCALLMSALQTMGVFRELAVVWFNPLDFFFQWCSMTTGDIESAKELRMGCGLPHDPVAKYIIRQCIPPICISLVALAATAKSRIQKADLMITFSNAAGTLLTVFFISTVLGAVSPLVCYEHPGESGSSVRSHPSVLCFSGDSAHQGMVITGVFSFLLIPLPYIVFSIFMVWRLPSMVKRMSEQDSRVLVGTRFFFERFSPERYYFGIVFVVRNVSICLIPVAFLDVNHQVTLVCAVLFVYMLIQQALQPWRTPLNNAFDGLATALLAMLLITGVLGARIFGGMFLVIFCLLAVYVVGLAFKRVVRVTPFYDFFICHDSKDASAQVRMLRLKLEAEKGLKSFVDMDSAANLEAIFDIVKCQVGTLVMYLTQETLTRPACTGSLAIAYLTYGKVKVMGIYTRSFALPTPEQIENGHSYIDISGCGIGQNGITARHLQMALQEFLRPETTRIEVPNVLNSIESFKHVSNALLKKEVDMDICELSSIPRAKGMLVLSMDLDSDEASAAAMMFLSRARALKPEAWGVKVCDLAKHASEDFEHLGFLCANARAVLLFLSAGSLRSLQQIVVIAETMHAIHGGVVSQNKQPPKLLPIRLPDFSSPGAGYYTKVLPVLMPRCHEIIMYIKDVMSLHSLDMSTNKPLSILDAEVIDITGHLHEDLEADVEASDGETMESLFSNREVFRSAIAMRMQDFMDTNNSIAHRSSRSSLSSSKSEKVPDMKASAKVDDLSAMAEFEISC